MSVDKRYSRLAPTSFNTIEDIDPSVAKEVMLYFNFRSELLFRGSSSVPTDDKTMLRIYVCLTES
jgi:hypothetical protein